MKIVAFAASYSKNSINRLFAGFTAKQFKNTEIELLDLNNYKLPVFTVDEEAENGFPKVLGDFLHKLAEADLLVVSMAEHNGSYTAAFKNLFDWASRVKANMFDDKKMLLLSTSPGPRGGAGALETAGIRFPKHGAVIISTFSLPNFYDNFDTEKGIINEILRIKFLEVISLTQKKVFHT